MTRVSASQGGKLFLPNVDKAVVAEAKLTRYLLDVSSENGAAKARFFLAFGFRISAWQVFAHALKEHAATHSVAYADKRPFGVHYIIESHIKTPDTRNPSIRAIWVIDDGDDTPRLVTAYPR